MGDKTWDNEASSRESSV